MHGPEGAPARQRAGATRQGAGGLGYQLAQQLVAAGELVLDVQPKLGARVRLLATGATDKNDPNDARSVAIAALRSPARREVAAENHAAVLKLWSKRHRDLGRARTQVACRLHAVLCELIPGGIPNEITAAQATIFLEQIEPSEAVALARCELAAEFLQDLRRIDAQMRDTKKRLVVAARASGTTVTEVFGVGPVIAATMIGYVADASRFPSRDHFAAYNGTAPIEMSSGNRKIYRLSRRGNRRLNHAVHMAAVTQIRHRHSDGRAYYDRKLAEGKTASGQTPAGSPQQPGPGAREGNRGNDTDASAAGSHPENRLFGQATPGPESTLRPPSGHPPTSPAPAPKKSRKGS
jgi:transposase